MAMRNGKPRTRRFVVDGKKECADCLITKPIEEFCIYKSGKQTGTVVACCNPCKKVRDRKYREENPRTHKSATMKSQYGITLDEYEDILVAQNGVCGICKDPIDESATASRGYKRTYLDIDHCHKTDKVRGLLCRRCNTGLGHFKDDPRRLQAAIDYLNHGI